MRMDVQAAIAHLLADSNATGDGLDDVVKVIAWMDIPACTGIFCRLCRRRALKPASEKTAGLSRVVCAGWGSKVTVTGWWWWALERIGAVS